MANGKQLPQAWGKQVKGKTNNVWEEKKKQNINDKSETSEIIKSQELNANILVEEDIHNTELKCDETNEVHDAEISEEETVEEIIINDVAENAESETPEIDISFEGMVDKYSLGLTTKPKKKRNVKAYILIIILILFVTAIVNVILIFGKNRKDNKKNKSDETEYVYIPESIAPTTSYDEIEIEETTEETVADEAVESSTSEVEKESETWEGSTTEKRTEPLTEATTTINYECRHAYLKTDIKEATCYEEGWYEEKCGDCGYVWNMKIPKLEHNYVYSNSNDATCDKDGYYEYICTLCNESYRETIPLYGHSWIDATCFTPKTCSWCNKTEGKALGHSIDAAGYCAICSAQVRKVELKCSHDEITLDNKSEICTLTLDGYEALDSSSLNINVRGGGGKVDYSLGEWAGNSITLKLVPIKTDEVKIAVDVWDENYSWTTVICINSYVPTPAELSAIKFEGVGKNINNSWYAGSGMGVIEIKGYTIADYYSTGLIQIEVEMLVTIQGMNVDYCDFYEFKYEIFDESGICVENGTIFRSNALNGQTYLHSTYLYGLEQGNYVMKFS